MAHERLKSQMNEILLRVEASAISENVDGLRQCLAEGRAKLAEAENVLDDDSMETFKNTLACISKQLEENDQKERYRAEKEYSGGRGRPKLHITEEQLVLFKEVNYTGRKMADHFQCSNKTVYRRLKDNNLQPSNQFSDITNNELDERVADLKKSFPNSGVQMMQGYLLNSDVKVQRRRVRESLKRVDPDGCVSRWSRAVHRRQYHVPTPNALWHLDGHMKLIRWGFVTHGCIDGFSRLITFLRCSLDNKSCTVLAEFVQACSTYGLPLRVRSDHGSENTQVALFLNLLRNGSYHITGKSTHNQRIERLWRDMHNQVTSKYYHEFYELEELYNFENNTERKALHYVYLAAINADLLDSFKMGWNAHKLRTENHQSPQQLWLSGMLDNIAGRYTTPNECFGQNQNIGERLSSG